MGTGLATRLLPKRRLTCDNGKIVMVRETWWPTAGPSHGPFDTGFDARGYSCVNDGRKLCR